MAGEGNALRHSCAVGHPTRDSQSACNCPTRTRDHCLVSTAAATRSPTHAHTHTSHGAVQFDKTCLPHNCNRAAEKQPTSPASCRKRLHTMGTTYSHIWALSSRGGMAPRAAAAAVLAALLAVGQGALQAHAMLWGVAASGWQGGVGEMGPWVMAGGIPANVTMAGTALVSPRQRSRLRAKCSSRTYALHGVAARTQPGVSVWRLAINDTPSWPLPSAAVTGNWGKGGQ